MKPLPKDIPRHAGFSLVEVAVALLVIAVGVLAAFGLFPTGLQAGRASLDETRAIMFAEETFNNFRGRAASPNVAWAQLGNPNATIPAGYGGLSWRDPWDGTANTHLAPRISRRVRLNRYISLTGSTAPAGHFVADPDLTQGIHEYSLRYYIEFYYLDADGNPLDPPPPPWLNDTMRASISLWVWPGEFGMPNVYEPKDSHDFKTWFNGSHAQTRPHYRDVMKDAYFFYTEIYNFRGPEQ